MSLAIYKNNILPESFLYELEKYNESVILTISTNMEDEKLKMGRFDASISYKGHKEYYFDYIGHAHSEKTLALYAILLGLAKLKRRMPIVVFMDLDILNIRNVLDKSVHEQIEEMANKKEVPSLTLIGVKEGASILKEFSIDPKE